MATYSREALQQRVFDLYVEHKYNEALDFLANEAAHFPKMSGRIFYWRMCLTAIQGQTQAALALFREALDKGFWYAESLLRGESDLTSLLGVPEFEQLLAISETRHAEAQAKTGTALLTYAPLAQAQSPYPLLIALHGNNSNATLSAEYWQPAVNEGWMVALPQSSQISGLDHSLFTWNDETLAECEVQAHENALRRAYDIDGQRVVLGGFSMGGRLAVGLALRRSIQVRGFISFAPYLGSNAVGSSPNPDNIVDTWLPQLKIAQEHGLRACLITGDKDVGYESIVKFADVLQEHNIPCMLKVYPGMGHTYPPDFPQLMPEALAFILS